MSNLAFTIGEVATLLGITPKTIKHYHHIGIFPEPTRDDNNYRLYGMAEIMALKQILRLKQFGLSLKQIGIIVKSDNPDDLVKVVLEQHADNIRHQLAQLQYQLDETTAFLNADKTLSDTVTLAASNVSSLTVFSDSVKQHSNGVSDILVEIEHEVLPQLDQFNWDETYEPFWHYSGKRLIDMLTDEGLFIFWMERYLALSDMAADDLQGQNWLEELRHSAMRRTLSKALTPPTFSMFSELDQQRILKLLPSLLYEAGTPLQKQFLALLIQK